MATTKFATFKPKRVSENNFWFSLGIEDAKITRADAVHQGFKPKVYRNLADKTKLSQSEFCKITHIPLSTMKRRLKNDERFSTQESDAMYRLALLIKLATDLFSDEKKAVDWIRESVYGLGGKRPLAWLPPQLILKWLKILLANLSMVFFHNHDLLHRIKFVVSAQHSDAPIPTTLAVA